MERIGIYGGTFNPPHIGHIRAADCAIDKLGLNKLLLIPDRIAPHKIIPEGSPSPQQRLEMLRCAAAGADKMDVSDLELRRPTVSYTYETVAQLHDLYPEAKLYLLMGTDMFLSFSQWRKPEEILRYAALGVFYRGEAGERERVSALAAQMADYEIVLLENPVTAISSTQLRRLLAFGCAEEFLPAGVGHYIREHGLYGTGKAYCGLSETALEQTVVRLLDPGRVAHVLGCRDTAVALARRYGANETDAARAALLHDITKALDGPLQLTVCRAYGEELDSFSAKNAKTLHALTGALVAKWVFGENEAVVSAIRSHTTGKANMNLLEKIIYVADYVEPNRNFPGVEKLRQLADTDITAALTLGLEMTLDMLKKQGREISPESAEALKDLKERKEKELC